MNRANEIFMCGFNGCNSTFTISTLASIGRCNRCNFLCMLRNSQGRCAMCGLNNQCESNSYIGLPWVSITTGFCKNCYTLENDRLILFGLGLGYLGKIEEISNLIDIPKIVRIESDGSNFILQVKDEKTKKLKILRIPIF